MSRYRVTTQEVIAEGRRGPLHWQWVAQGNALALFSVRERNAILKDCTQRMGDYWIAEWLPKRFTNYAKVLGYHAGMKYQKSKTKQFGEAIPLVYSGHLQSAALQGATAKGQAGTTTGPSVILRIPTGNHRLAAIVQQVLRTIPAFEVKAMANAFGERLKALVNGADTSDPRRSRLTKMQRTSIGFRNRDQRTRSRLVAEVIAARTGVRRAS